MKRYFGIFNADEINQESMFRHSMEEDRAIKNPERCSRIIKIQGAGMENQKSKQSTGSISMMSFSISGHFPKMKVWQRKSPRKHS